MSSTDAPARQANLSSLASGTRAHWVTDEARLEVSAWHRQIRELVRRGETVNTAPSVVHRMSIFDRQVAMVPLDAANHSSGALLVRSPVMISGLIALFEEVLDRSTPVRLPPPLEASRHLVLVMLALGAKDDAIARKMDLSTRTVRRVISSLMIECGADSRFQLAIAAVRLGWLSADDLTAKDPPGSHSRE